jgi:hypothetical protein
MTLSPLRAVLFCLAIASLPGCQVIWASITSPSDWIAGSVNSISGSIQAISRSSGSPTGGTASLAYRRDVRAWTTEVARTGTPQDEFLRGVGRIAESHGLTHWEAEPATLVAIGEGLRDAGWTPEQMQQLSGELTDVQPEKVELVLEGYGQAGS